MKHVVNDVRELAPYDLELIADFAGFGTTTAGAIEVIADRGRVVQVGLGQAESTINTQLLTLKQLDLVGSLGGTPADTVEVINFLASGDLRIATKSLGFEEIPSGLDILKRGEAEGQRFVADVRP